MTEIDTSDTSPEAIEALADYIHARSLRLANVQSMLLAMTLDNTAATVGSIAVSLAHDERVLRALAAEKRELSYHAAWKLGYASGLSGAKKGSAPCKDHDSAPRLFGERITDIPTERLIKHLTTLGDKPNNRVWISLIEAELRSRPKPEGDAP